MQILKFPNFPSFPMFVPPLPPSLHINFRVREPQVSHTGINVCAHCPLHLPKKVTEKPSVNHIGSSDEPPKTCLYLAAGNSSRQEGEKTDILNLLGRAVFVCSIVLTMTDQTYFQVTRKSSYVNARGIPPAA